MVVHILHNRSETDIQHGEILELKTIPHDFDLLALGVGDDLSRDVDLVRQVEYVETEVVGQVRVVQLFVGGQAQFDDVLDFLAGDLNRSRGTPGTRRII